jgi:hypothetical protein
MYGTELIDPQSDISLFLARKIRQTHLIDRSKEWSHYLQEKLIEKISPEFEKKFPESRLGSSVVKKVWDKINHLSELFEKQNDALTAEGKLNLHFLIRENLKTVLQQKNNHFSHPYLAAQELALKIGESLASYEGVRPELQQLTELIWTSLYHLLPARNLPAYENTFEAKNRLIVKWMVDALAKESDLAFTELKQLLQHKITFFKTLGQDLSQEIQELSMQWARALLPSTSLFQTQSSEALRKLRAWIKTQMQETFSEDQILKIKASALSLNLNISLYDLEILYWCTLQETRPSKKTTPLLDELLLEAKSHLFHHPQEHWTTAIDQAAAFLQRAHEISKAGSASDWNHRITLWASQGELILRFLQLPATPLLHLAHELKSKNRSFADPAITTQLREQYLSRFSSPLIEPSYVHQMADLTRKYGWYCLESHPQESSLERWALLQKDKNGQKLSLKTFPLLPFYTARR